METITIHSYLTYAGKGMEIQPEIGGTDVRPVGKLYTMLKDTFDKADDECKIEVAFSPSPDQTQQNDCRDLVVRYLRKPSLETGRPLADRLQSVTTNRSGLGLLFLMHSRERSRIKIVISRFPADSGIVARQKSAALSVEFIEEVFMKSATAYKSVTYQGTSFDADFWDGKAVDKQINIGTISISDYWIRAFLLSDLKTTGPAGTRRVALALRAIVNRTDHSKLKEEIAAVSTLSSNLNGRRTSGPDLVKQLHLSDELELELRREIPEALFKERFEFDSAEFNKHLAYRMIELDSGGIIMAEVAQFERVFKHRQLPGSRHEYTTEGKVVEDKYRVRR